MKLLATGDLEKTLDIEEFFNAINVRNNQLIQIKKRPVDPKLHYF